MLQMGTLRVVSAGVATASVVAFYLLRKRCASHVQLFDVQEERVIKRVLFCRHGEGRHNTNDEHGKSQLHLFDPELTEQGIAEARAIFADALPGRLDFKPQIVFVSPLWRTLQTATEAMMARSDGYMCPMIAHDDLREHNNLNACNYRRPIQEAHLKAFPRVDFSGVAVDTPPPAAEWLVPYKAAFGILRNRAERALKFIDACSEEQIAVFCHGTFMRAVLSNVMQVGPHHAAKPPRTGQSLEVVRIETPTGDRYWELMSDQIDGHEVLRLAWRNEGGSAVHGECDDGASTLKRSK